MQRLDADERKSLCGAAAIFLNFGATTQDGCPIVRLRDGALSVYQNRAPIFPNFGQGRWR
jgi:hypothetical protein